MSFVWGVDKKLSVDLDLESTGNIEEVNMTDVQQKVVSDSNALQEALCRTAEKGESIKHAMRRARVPAYYLAAIIYRKYNVTLYTCHSHCKHPWTTAVTPWNEESAAPPVAELGDPEV